MTGPALAPTHRFWPVGQIQMKIPLDAPEERLPPAAVSTQDRLRSLVLTDGESYRMRQVRTKGTSMVNSS